MNTNAIIEKYESVQATRKELKEIQEEIYNNDMYYEENEREIYELIIDLHRAVIKYLVEIQEQYQNATSDEERKQIQEIQQQYNINIETIPRELETYQEEEEE